MELLNGDTHVHARTESVEDTCDSDVNSVLPMEAVCESFGNTFAFVIAGAGANWVNVTPADWEEADAGGRWRDKVTLDSTN